MNIASIREDLGFAMRFTRKNAFVPAITIVSLAIGVGATTVVYSALDAVLLRPLNFANPDRLVVVREGEIHARDEWGGVAPGDFVDLSNRSHSFSSLAACSGALLNISGSESERVQAASASASFLRDVLQVRPVAGRLFTAEEDERHAPVAVLSYGLWQRQFSGDRSVAGRTVRLSAKRYTIVGVLPASVRYPAVDDPPLDPQVWIPLSLSPADRAQRGARYLNVFGRLKTGVSVATAQSEMDAIGRELQRQYPASNADRGIWVKSLAGQVASKVKSPAIVVAGSVALLLLITCVDIAALMLARIVRRKREVAVRLALGAAPTRIVQQLLIESVFLSVIGGLLGIGLAYVGRDALVHIVSQGVPQLEHLALSGRVLLFGLAVTVVTGIGFGLAPALQAARTDTNTTLREEGRTPTLSKRGNLVLESLVTAQFAFSVLLLVGAGLLIRSFFAVQGVNLGFNKDSVLSFETSLPLARYSPNQFAPTVDTILTRIAALPGVRAAGSVNVLPLGGDDFGWTFHVESHPAPEGAPLPVAAYRVVSPDYFSAMSIQVLRGHKFTNRNTAASSPVAIVSASMANRYWPGEDVLGRRVRLDGPLSDFPWLTIVGVVADIRDEALEKPPQPSLYRPFSQHPMPDLAIVVRTQRSPGHVVSDVRSVVASVDRDLPLAKVRNLDDVVSHSMAPRRFVLVLMAAFATIALLLAMLGIFGVMSYVFSQRLTEFAVKLALGAEPGRIFAQSLWRGVRLAVTGIVIGMALSAGMTHAVQSMLFEVKTTDPLTYFGVLSMAVAVAAFACLIPSWRASRADLKRALRG